MERFWQNVFNCNRILLLAAIAALQVIADDPSLNPRRIPQELHHPLIPQETSTERLQLQETLETRSNIVTTLLTINRELNKKSPPGNGDSKGGFRATQRC